jgi:hypothetical protein
MHLDARVVAVFGVVFSILFVSMGVARILPWEAAGTLAATTIGVVSVLVAIVRQETKNGPTNIVASPQSEADEGLLWEESILVSKNSCSHYSFSIEENERLTGEISSDDYFNMYIVTPRNFREYQDGNEEFSYEYGTEHASKLKVNFIPDKAGKFYCIIESASKTDIDVNVSLHLRKA